MKSLAEQSEELQQTAKALPEIRAEIKKWEISVGKLTRLLGGETAVRRGRPPKEEAKAKRRGRPKTRKGLKEKVLQALAKGPLAAPQLRKVDGRALPGALDKWVSEGILKKEAKGLYARA